MTHYVGRSVEGDEGVVVADGMSVERLVCGGGDGGVGDHVVVVVEEPDAVSGERHTGVGPQRDGYGFGLLIAYELPAVERTKQLAGHRHECVCGAFYLGGAAFVVVKVYCFARCQ